MNRVPRLAITTFLMASTLGLHGFAQSQRPPEASAGNPKEGRGRHCHMEPELDGNDNNDGDDGRGDELPPGSIVQWGSQIVPDDLPSGFIDIASDGNHSLGLLANGSIVTWGSNHEGQGDVPQPNTDFVAVAAGQFHSMGLKSDGSIVIWGCNTPKDYGQCLIPLPNTGFVKIAANSKSSLALRGDGSIVSWGEDAWGLSHVPSPNMGFIDIATSGLHHLALRADGSILPWGINIQGEAYVPSPNADFVAVSAGPGFSLGLKRDGSIVAWGCGEFSDDHGECDVPPPNEDFMAMVAEGARSVGLRSSGVVEVWGCIDYDYDYGQCDEPDPDTGFVKVAAAWLRTLAITGTFGDLNSNGPIDSIDYQILNGFLAGPQQLGPPGFSRGSLDGDVDVDLADFARFQNAFMAVAAPALGPCDFQADCPLAWNCFDSLCFPAGGPDVELWMDIGTVEPGPVPEGGDIPLFMGIQGGHHIFATLRTTGFPPDAFTSVTVSIAAAESGVEFVPERTYPATFNEIMPGINELEDLFIVFSNPPPDPLNDVEVVVSFEVTLNSAPSVSASLTQHAILVPPQ